MLSIRKNKGLITIEKEIIDLLKSNGASLVGFADLNGLYPDIPNEIMDTKYSYGVSIAVKYPKEVIKSIANNPTIEYFDEYNRINNKLDGLAILCSTFIKEKGFEAFPQTTNTYIDIGGYRSIMPHKTVAISSGLGWIGKSALFVTEEFGSAIRITSVLTNMKIEKATNAMKPKCGDCMICKNACPGEAISGLNWSQDIDRDDFYNAKKCRIKAREISAKELNKEITLCGKCIVVCPYTKRYLDS